MAKEIIYETPVGFFSGSKKDLLELFEKKGIKIKAKDIFSVESTTENVSCIRTLLNLDSEVKRAIQASKLWINRTPTRTFEIGEKVYRGNLERSVVTNIFEDGLVLTISDDGKRELPCFWFDVFKEQYNTETLFSEEKYFLRYSNSTISSLLYKQHSFGLNMNPSYQRDYVWSQEDKVALIDSIFNRCDIGRFVFVRLEEGIYNYEILDGKQRLSAIIEFVEDRFQYKGRFFSELSKTDQYMFGSSGVMYADIEDRGLTEKAKMEIFVRINSFGKVMDKDHLDKVRTILCKL